jgi:thiol peroxidase
MEERKGAATYKGQPVTLVGPEVKVGQRALDFKAVGIDMQEVSLSQSKGKVRLLSVVHSLNTPVCDLQTRFFDQEVSKYPNVAIYTVSMDLPFAQARYSSEHNIRNLKLFLTIKASFGTAYGLLIKNSFFPGGLYRGCR